MDSHLLVNVRRDEGIGFDPPAVPPRLPQSGRFIQETMSGPTVRFYWAEAVLPEAHR
ncbi:hypothetical protein [Flaviflexus equikiangi]|uniref:Uncharacterized protein n=1 Tax=Flaviflexus equikiangi TaxID=2758573 RepID=A0ABS2TEE6_9ACTO|nr:hypothetical protein [Flaviflexus equikiangi]MBM9433025.1 hypothetical protein [Flaviflexus equikiangi]